MLIPINIMPDKVTKMTGFSFMEMETWLTCNLTSQLPTLFVL
jgi:hypothetical protein